MGDFFISGAGDIDGDGKPEVIGGAPGALNSTGEVFIWFGSDLQTQSEPLPRIRLQGDISGSSFGRHVMIADINGDGYDDVIVGAPTLKSDNQIAAGGLYVFLGQEGFKNWLPIMSAEQADFSTIGDRSGLNTGQWINAADFDDNGADDLLLFYRD